MRFAIPPLEPKTVIFFINFFFGVNDEKTNQQSWEWRLSKESKLQKIILKSNQY